MHGEEPRATKSFENWRSIWPEPYPVDHGGESALVRSPELGTSGIRAGLTVQPNCRGARAIEAPAISPAKTRFLTFREVIIVPLLVGGS